MYILSSFLQICAYLLQVLFSFDEISIYNFVRVCACDENNKYIRSYCVADATEINLKSVRFHLIYNTGKVTGVRREKASKDRKWNQIIKIVYRYGIKANSKSILLLVRGVLWRFGNDIIIIGDTNDTKWIEHSILNTTW